MVKICLFIVVVSIFSGCSILPSYRAEIEGRKMITDYRLNKVAVERAIKEKRVIYGMTMEEVIESWGNPDVEHELIINGRLYQSWAYKKGSRTKIIYFRNGIVVDIK